MDFLEPNAKKKRAISQIIGYTLIGILIAIATLILVFQAYGFDVDRKTGDVIQNGLVFVDSAPDDAAIFLNGNLHKDRTNVRLTLTEGTYELKIRKDGYRDWVRTFELLGGSIERYTYPMLIPNDLAQKDIASLGQAPTFYTQSLDRKFIIHNKGASLTDWVEHDTSSLDGSEKPLERAFSLPAELFQAAEGAHSLELVEWSTDNRHFLVKHTYTGGYEFVVISRDSPATSLNVNKLLGQNPNTLVLRDKKFDQWYLHTTEGGVLQTANAQKQIETVMNNVTAFKSHDDTTLLYTEAGDDPKMQRVMLRQNKETYHIRDISAGPVKLDVAKYDNAWYVAVGSQADKKIYIYKDPISQIDKAARADYKPTLSAVLRSNDTLDQVSFSQNTRFIMAQSGQHIEVYDAEYQKTYRHDVAKTFDSGVKLTWMDGHRLQSRSGGKIIMFDYDGANLQELVGSVPGVAFFDRDYTVLYGASVKDSGEAALNVTSLRFEQDK